MSSFTEAWTDPLGVKNNRGRWLSVVRGRDGDGFVFWIGSPTEGQRFHIPEGFITDGASIPLWVQRLLPRRVLRWVLSRLLKAAIVHDYLRRNMAYSLIDADAQFLVAMAADGLRWGLGAGTRLQRLSRVHLSIARVALRETAFVIVRLNRTRT